jgi:hypothetical protein
MVPLVELIERAERVLRERGALLNKAAGSIGSGKKSLGSNPLSALRAIIADIRKCPPELCGPDWNVIFEGLTRHESELEGRFQKDFPIALRTAAEEARLSFRGSGGQITVGPFGVHVDYDKCTATLEYAKLEVAKDIPLDPSKLVTEVAMLGDAILAPLSDPKNFALQLEESVRVVVARQRKSIATDELRAELPLVYREMLYLRQAWNSPTARRKFVEYPLARFVVEIKSLLQSEQNFESARRFRLEPAVIENTKNLNKAFYFPKDLADGYGEGMYFQAIVLTQTR